MSRNKQIKKFLIIVPLILCAGILFCLLLNRGAFLPSWVRWMKGTRCDAQRQYELILSQKAVTVLYKDTPIWMSPQDIKVQDAVFLDADNDGEEELVLLCWKKGRYGRHKPFWVQKDEKGWSQHIFVYECQTEEIRPKWMSSYIGQDAAAVSGNEKTAPDCRLLLTGRDGKISSWFWNSWGFTKEDTEVSFVVFGDNLIHEPIYRYGFNFDDSFGFLFENFEDIIKISDIAVINQETPLTDDPAQYGDYPRFGTPIQVGEAIADAGFTVVTCATNHALDRGIAGINMTKDFFTSAGTVCLGIQSTAEKEDRPYSVLTKNGIRLALFNYTYGTNGIAVPEEYPYTVHLLQDEKKIREDLAKARSEADAVLVFVHWGTEYAAQPDSFQKTWTQIFLQSRVDVVVGTHPHALQPYELIQDENGHEMLVFYSIGNFVSAQSEKTCTKGGMAEFTISLTTKGYRITDYSLEPLTITWQKGGGFQTDF